MTTNISNYNFSFKRAMPAVFKATFLEGGLFTALIPPAWFDKVLT